MKRDDSKLREILRASDPARGAELSPVERARIRATILETARARPKVWLRPVTLGWGAACILVMVAVLFASRGRVRTDHRADVAPIPDAPARATLVPEKVESPVPSQPTGTRPVLVHREPPVRRRPRSISGVDVPTTRIVFTAPEGTRIFWFGAETPSKEDAT